MGCCPLIFLITALLEALTKNGSSAANGTHRRRPAHNAGDGGAKAASERAEGTGAGSSKVFTKEQVEGVQR